VSTPIGIGSAVWWRDESKRVYTSPGCGPTERGYWSEVKVIGESPRMWLLSGYAGKLPKNGKVPMGYATSVEMMERTIWLTEHRYRISQAVGRLGWGAIINDQDAVIEKFAAIAAIVGYEPLPPGAALPLRTTPTAKENT
jgi:hypothetical protein